ncbi:MAG: hypothetical protein ACPGJV_15780, partial [Bacteriovoracaceae bacterium]
MIRVIFRSITILFISMLLFKGCTSKPTKNIEKYYVPSGSAKYVLPEIPDWSNWSASGQCKRNFSTKYLDFASLKKSFAMSFSESIMLQASFNQLRENLLKKPGVFV